VTLARIRTCQRCLISEALLVSLALLGGHHVEALIAELVRVEKEGGRIGLFSDISP
jgi:hypothetical protein